MQIMYRPEGSVCRGRLNTMKCDVLCPVLLMLSTVSTSARQREEDNDTGYVQGAPFLF